MFDTARFFSRLEGELEIGEPQGFANLRLAPLSIPALGAPISTLSQALKKGEAELSEIGDGGHVPEVHVKNKGELALLLLDGEEILGAKQNRVFNTSILVAAKSELRVPVSCVEAGRWHRRSANFGSTERVLPASLRASKASRVTRSLRDSGRADADQQQVWRDVERYSTARGVASPTHALADVFDADARRKDAYRQELPPPKPGQTGVAAWVGGKLVSVDLLGNAEAFAECHERLLHGAIAEALLVARGERGGPETAEEAKAGLGRLLKGLAEAAATEHAGTGIGRELRVTGQAASAALLVDEQGALVHLQAFGA